MNIQNETQKIKFSGKRKVTKKNVEVTLEPKIKSDESINIVPTRLDFLHEMKTACFQKGKEFSEDTEIARAKSEELCEIESAW